MDVVAFGALIKRKRGETKLSQEKLAGRIYGDPARKSDISRLERGLVASPQEKTIQYLCTALKISTAEMEPIRQSRISAAQLDQIPTLSLEALQVLASKFGIETPYDQEAPYLRQQLTFKANEHRELVKDIAAFKGLSARIDNIHAAALNAAENENSAEANELLQDALEIHSQEILHPALETNAKLMEAQARIALIGGNTDQAFLLFSSAADSFAAVDP